VVLEIVGGRTDRHIVGEIGLFAQDASHLRDKVLDVPVAHFLAQRQRNAGAIKLVDRDAEFAHCFDHHL
jgi:hypothetical protein